MQYQVPQFIDVEDKIFGPLTFRQFIYVVGGLGLSYVVYRFTPSLVISAAPIALILIFSGALAFYKFNNRPFIHVLEAAFKYAVASKLYLWKKKSVMAPTAKTGRGQAAAVPEYAGVMVPKVSSSKLKSLAWSLDIQERVNSGEDARRTI